ncbi:ABC transporter substrate-binding protein [Kineosporia sp. J2-2]|uniref:ABC transporter substrate-binding protein n=1 Tax=Kineosporia corallincola TaxID=2835133 RepID=A0ABS5TG20_9ACTN|nr:ABC transporter substrate-binding protein [Kineosporia corallincola]MBT0770016.1 ABC transporter substrate-binding protein [Kineosporia corallincola]
MSMTHPGRRAGAVAAAFLSAALLLTACGDDDSTASTTPAAPTTRTVTADNGSVQVPSNPQRVVTIGNTTLPFIDLGGKPISVTAVSDSTLELLPDDEQATYGAATNLGDGDVDLEKLAALTPDLILVQIDDAGFKKIEKELQEIAPTVFWGLDTEWKGFADAIAEAGNTTATLTQQKTEFEDKVKKIQENYSTILADTSFVDVSRGQWNDPGTFYIADIGCSEVGRDDVHLKLPQAADGADPLAYTSLPFEKISELSEYDVITYPVDVEGKPLEAFQPVTETNTWKALPAVKSGRALGLLCPGNNSYKQVNRYLDSLDQALATLPQQ